MKFGTYVVVMRSGSNPPGTPGCKRTVRGGAGVRTRSEVRWWDASAVRPMGDDEKESFIFEVMPNLMDERPDIFNALLDREADILYLYSYQQKCIKGMATIFGLTGKAVALLIASGIEHVYTIVSNRLGVEG